jgi:phthiocerol/phenolphthiocerol synthesis type-I polyketide synthase E
VSTHRLDTAVAVTGLACRFPGAPDVRTFWRNLSAGASAVRRFDPAELRRAGVAEALLRNPSFVPACAPLPDPFAFDAAHFGIVSSAARWLDLQHRVFLECAWTALEASGTLAAARRAVAVFAGCSDTTWTPVEDGEDGQAGLLAASLGSGTDYLASRVAYLLDLRGPSVTVRAACATSLVAVHQAVQSLLTHECDAAVAGGAAVRYPLRRGHVHEPGGIYSSDGLCRPYDHLGSGIVSGDGAGAVVLRRLADALADGDPIHAVVCGSAVTNDGARKGSFTAPSVEGQVEAAVTAMEVADVDPARIGYVEGHGTATPMGDPIEVEALRRAWATGTRGTRRCVLGSVKSMIGHLDAAAGIAGLVKACLAVEHGRIPGTLNYSAPNPHCGLPDSPFVVSADALAWDGPGPRLASVHSLGLGGTNAHVVLEQAPDRAPRGAAVTVPVALTLSTRRPEAMGPYAAELAAELAAPGADVAAAALTLQAGRVPGPYRRVVVGRDREELGRALLSLREPELPAATRPRLVLAFSGDGKRVEGALKQLAEHLPPVASTLRAAAAHLRSRWGIDLSAALHGAGPSPVGIIPAVVAQGAAVHAALAHFGAGGDLVLGQSLGELTAAVASGLIGLEDALDLAVAREHAFRSVVPSGALAVSMAPGALLERLPRHLELSLVNSPNRCVVSGEARALAPFAAQLEAEDVPVQRLELISAVHSSLLDPVLDDFRGAAARLRPRRPARAFLSSVGPGEVDEGVAADPDHWARQLREPVHFDACLRAAVAGHPDTVVVDVGPTGGLTAAIQETVGGEVRGVVRVSPHGPGASELEAFASALGRLWEHGVPVDWEGWPRRAAHRTSLPVPPLARTIHEPVGHGATPGAERTRPQTVALWTRNWRRAHPAPGGAARGRRTLVLAGADPFCHELGGWLARLGQDVQVVARAARPGAGEHFDLVVDARGLGEPDGPGAAAAFLATAAEAARQPAASPRLVVLTRGAFDILGTEALSPGAAALAAASLVAAQEHGGFDLTCLDLPPGAIDAGMAARVIVSGAGPGVWLGLRGRAVWRPVMEPLDRAPDPRVLVPTGGACVVTGGLGRFGRWVGRWLAEHGFAELLVASRTGVPSGPSAEAVAAMRRAGARVTVVRADVADRAAVFRLLDDASRSASGPVTIFHLAGAPNADSAFAPLADLARGDPRAALEEQWAAKVGGALAILDWMRGHPGARCVAFSSNAAVLGGPGLAAYAAANAALDAVGVSARDREGLDWCSVGWDGWRLPDDEPSVARTALESYALRRDEPWTALRNAVAAGLGHVVVARGDFAERHRVWVEAPSTADSAPDPEPPPGGGPGTAGDGADLVAAVRKIWSEVLGSIPADDADLFEQGGDSLTAMRIRIRIERLLEAQLTLQDVLQNRTVSGLAALVREQAGPEARTGARGARTSAPTAAEPTVRGRI